MAGKQLEEVTDVANYGGKTTERCDDGKRHIMAGKQQKASCDGNAKKTVADTGQYGGTLHLKAVTDTGQYSLLRSRCLGSSRKGSLTAGHYI